MLLAAVHPRCSSSLGQACGYKSAADPVAPFRQCPEGASEDVRRLLCSADIASLSPLLSRHVEACEDSKLLARLNGARGDHVAIDPDVLSAHGTGYADSACAKRPAMQSGGAQIVRIGGPSETSNYQLVLRFHVAPSKQVATRRNPAVQVSLNLES